MLRKADNAVFASIIINFTAFFVTERCEIKFVVGWQSPTVIYPEVDSI